MAGEFALTCHFFHFTIYLYSYCMTRILLYCLLLVAFTALNAQQRYAIEFDNRSEIRINGTTNVISFEISQKITNFTGLKKQVNIQRSAERFTIAESKIDIPVSMFESDNKMALRDFKKLIKSTDYPHIILKINHISPEKTSLKNKESKLIANIDLTIAGQTKRYAVDFQITKIDTNYQLAGSKRISIRDFGLEPPTTMMGLIKVSEWIVISIDGDCAIKKQ